MSEHTPTPWSTNGTFLWLTDDRATINKLGHHYAMDIPDGYLDAIPRDQWTANLHFICHAVNHHDELVAALKPFAVLATPHGDDHEQIAHNVGVTLGDCRRARAVLAKMESGS